MTPLLLFILSIVGIIIAIGVPTWIAYASYKKMQQYETVLEIYENHLTELSELIADSRKVIDIVDANGHFRTDDEVEEFFEALKEIQQNLDEFNLASGNPNNLNEKEN